VRSREIARRYAEALYAIAVEDGQADALQGELQELVSAISEVSDFVRLFEHPLASKTEKLELLERSFPGMSAALRNAVRVLIHNGREAYLAMILDEFLAVRAEQEGLVPVRVVAAQPLAAEEKDQLKARLERALGRRVVLEEGVDPRLLAGLRIETAGKVVDGTLRAKLGELQQILER
jgi:F-type H+-transporting ATPase subunit delta